MNGILGRVGEVGLQIVTAALLLAYFSCSAIAGEEISLYNSSNDAVAYIAVDDDLTIYLWGGKPVAYVDGENIYGFNGKHLGWFSRGAVYDHDGYAACATKERLAGYAHYEPYKGFKEFKPFKSFEEFAPFKPIFNASFGDTTCSIFLSFGAS
jgi:hypothetical protein